MADGGCGLIIPDRTSYGDKSQRVASVNMVASFVTSDLLFLAERMVLSIKTQE